MPSPVECERDVTVKYNDPGIVPEPGPIIIKLKKFFNIIKFYFSKKKKFLNIF